MRRYIYCISVLLILALSTASAQQRAVEPRGKKDKPSTGTPYRTSWALLVGVVVYLEALL